MTNHSFPQSQQMIEHHGLILPVLDNVLIFADEFEQAAQSGEATFNRLVIAQSPKDITSLNEFLELAKLHFDAFAKLDMPIVPHTFGLVSIDTIDLREPVVDADDPKFYLAEVTREVAKLRDAQRDTTILPNGFYLAAKVDVITQTDGHAASKPRKIALYKANKFIQSIGVHADMSEKQLTYGRARHEGKDREGMWVHDLDLYLRNSHFPRRQGSKS